MKGSLSDRGVGLFKDQLSPQDESKIRKDLTVKPFSIPNSIQQSKPFPIYRESTKKIYVPRFYGSNEFGIPIQVDSTKIYQTNSPYALSKLGALEFEGSMRLYQENIVDAYMNEARKSGCGLLEIPCGRGKCLGVNTPIWMYNGHRKMVQDVVDGDVLMGDEGLPRYVNGVTHGKSHMYQINQESGISYRVNEWHILTLYDKLKKQTVDVEVSKAVCLPNAYHGIRYDPETKTRTLTNIAITKEEAMDDYYGFCVGGNRRFLLGDGTVTHNTVMALNIMSKLKVKTLVIVHKEFLLNQWIERIEQFLPHAKVGKIQGKIIDTDGKDIVIGMLQSLSMKNYEKDTFLCFGLAVIDECHHISAEVFSRSLFKIVCPYMLGLSATMERKDQLTFVFKMFLGEVVYREKRQGTDEVEVRCITYETIGDEEFSRVEYNFKGQTHYSKMIKKLCEYRYRTEFIVKVVEDTMKEGDYQGEKRQLMILAHNKSILHDLEKDLKALYSNGTFDERSTKTIGYYVGGMKEVDLKATEKNDIILATYAMAEEALDIKSLSALLLATPKTDVTQAVGRILRIKHKYPLVIDVVDEHDIFKRQWAKRKRYYSKCNYTITQCGSMTYHSDYKNWSNISSKSARNKDVTKPKKDGVMTQEEAIMNMFSRNIPIYVDTEDI